ncbi:ankyrin repeat domain-containing protein [Actinopolymorpha sp. B17G11]|uniref:ankyrin repeat domain-containing protein n=1 Tax=Actinopolymorpha sp. B17G11 TaxID=3160861 RepID=UPI0032E3BE16
MSSRTLPVRPDLDQLRRQAKDLHRAAAAGEPDARARISVVSPEISLHTAQLALAREYGFASWPRLHSEVKRLRLIADGDVDGFASLVAADPALATDGIRFPDSDTTLPALQYIGIGLLHGWWNHHRPGDLTRVLLAQGVSTNGDGESPLITAASHGEPEMVRVLIDAGADLEATGPAAPGSGTALAHAVHYGIVPAVDILVGAGAVVHDLVEAAGAGDIDHYGLADVTHEILVGALRAAAVCERLTVIDQILDTGLDVNSEFRTLTEPGGGTALHCAAWEGKDASVAHLLTRGADPNRRVEGVDPIRNATPLAWCRHRSGVGHGGNHTQVEAILEPITNSAS